METLLLRKRHFLRMESLQVRHLAVQRSKVYKSINLIRKEYWFLLTNTTFAGANLHKEIISTNLA